MNTDEHRWSEDNLPDWQLRSHKGLEYYGLQPAPGVFLAFATRNGGISRTPHDSLNLSPDVGDVPDAIAHNRARLARALHLQTLATLKQTHSDLVLHITHVRMPQDTVEGDALFTNIPGVALGIKVADCLPAYIYSKNTPAIGLAHCGRRGTALRIAEKLARQMSRTFSIALTDLCFSLGPCICANCYTVGEDVAADFRRQFPEGDRFLFPKAHPQIPQIGSENEPAKPAAGESWHLDLRAANRRLLSDMGLTEAASLDLCSFENREQLYSARRDRTTGRNLAVIVLR